MLTVSPLMLAVTPPFTVKTCAPPDVQMVPVSVQLPSKKSAVGPGPVIVVPVPVVRVSVRVPPVDVIVAPLGTLNRSSCCRGHWRT